MVQVLVMKKLFNKLIERLAIWRLLGRNKVLYEFSVKDFAGFKITFRRYYMDIVSESRNFKLRMSFYTQPYLYLLESAKQGNRDNVYGFTLAVYQTSMLLCTDQKFIEDNSKALSSCVARIEQRAADKPKASDFENDLALREVKANVERGQMTRQQRRKAEREARKRMKEGLEEMRKEETSNETQKGNE